MTLSDDVRWGDNKVSSVASGDYDRVDKINHSMVTVVCPHSKLIAYTYLPH